MTERELRKAVDRQHLRFAEYEGFAQPDLYGDVRGAWRVSQKHVRRLFAAARQARAAVNRADRAKRHDALPDAVESFRIHNDQLQRADDWMKRLEKPLRNLDPTARRALRALVQLGCSPNALLRCIEAQKTWGSSGGDRSDSLAYRDRLRKLASSFDALAKDCELYLRVRDRSPRATYPLDSNIPLWLRQQAARFTDFVDQVDPHLGRGRQAEQALVNAMEEVKTFTGHYHESLMAELLTGSTSEEISAEGLRRWRARAVRRLKNRHDNPKSLAWSRYPRLVGDPAEQKEDF